MQLVQSVLRSESFKKVRRILMFRTIVGGIGFRAGTVVLAAATLIISSFGDVACDTVCYDVRDEAFYANSDPATWDCYTFLNNKKNCWICGVGGGYCPGSSTAYCETTWETIQYKVCPNCRTLCDNPDLYHFHIGDCGIPTGEAMNFSEFLCATK